MPKQVTDQEELRFAKTQNGYVATASVTLNAGVIALLKGSQLSVYQTIFAIAFIAIAADTCLAGYASANCTGRRVS
jgi:hypothetical protein